MGTRSSIAVKHGDVIKAVYCHWDGYLDYNGRILLGNYGSAKANNLVALGDLSSLRENIGEKHDFSGNEGRDNGWTTFYGRDRGEEDVSWRVFHSEKAWVESMSDAGCEYFYLMDNGVWFVSEGNNFTALHEAIEILDAEEAE